MMDEFSNDYMPDENYNGPHLEEGDYRMHIMSVVTGYSRNNNPMITAELGMKESTIVFKHYITKNEYFNANMTKFFDCFGIQRGNFNYKSWIGKTGFAHIAKGDVKENGKAYWEIACLNAVAPPVGPGARSALVNPATQARPIAQRQGIAPVRAVDELDADTRF